MADQILRREMVVERQAKVHRQEIQERIRQINGILSKSDDIPVRVSEEILGTGAVRAELERQLKEAGWRISLDGNVGTVFLN